MHKHHNHHQDNYDVDDCYNRYCGAETVGGKLLDILLIILAIVFFPITICFIIVICWLGFFGMMYESPKYDHPTPEMKRKQCLVCITIPCWLPIYMTYTCLFSGLCKQHSEEPTPCKRVVMNPHHHYVGNDTLIHV